MHKIDKNLNEKKLSDTFYLRHLKALSLWKLFSSTNFSRKIDLFFSFDETRMFTMAKSFNGRSSVQQIHSMAQLIISNQTHTKTFQINFSESK